MSLCSPRSLSFGWLMCIEGGELARCIIREGGGVYAAFLPPRTSVWEQRPDEQNDKQTRKQHQRAPLEIHLSSCHDGEQMCKLHTGFFFFFYLFFIFFLIFFTARSNAQHFSPSQEFPCAHYCLSQVLLYVSPPIAISNNITSCCYGKNLRHRGFN